MVMERCLAGENKVCFFKLHTGILYYIYLKFPEYSFSDLFSVKISTKK